MLANAMIEAVELIASATTPGERRVACALLDETVRAPLGRFCRSRAHLIMRGGEAALIQQGLWEPEGSPIRVATEHWLDSNPSRRPLLRPLRYSRSPLSTDACVQTLEPVIGYSGDVGGIALSPDGRHLYGHAYGSLRDLASDTAHVHHDWCSILLEWDAQSGQLVRTRRAGQHREGSTALAVSPGGTRLAVRDHRSIELRSTDDLSFEGTLKGCEGPYGGIAFIDEDHLAALDGHTLQLWSIHGGLTTVDSVGMWAFDLNHEHTTIAVAGGQSTAAIALHELPGGALHEELGECRRGHHGVVRSAIAFHPDGRHVFLGDWGNEVQLWDLDSRESIVLGQHGGSIECGQFSPSGTLLVTGDSHGVVHVWDTDKRQRKDRFAAHNGPVNEIVIDDAREEFITCGADGRVRRWSLPETPAPPRPLPPHVISATMIEIRTYEADQRVFTVAGLTHMWSPDGSGLGTAPRAKGAHYPTLAHETSSDRLVIDELGLELRVPIQVLREGTGVCILDPTKRVVLTSHEDRSLRLWDAQLGHIARVLASR